ncbi:hypothetical protein HDU85_004344 [Gaertneriomyces sp. JEL0708]|nr:hypothetical protein HDU85_004344 [Gaertneriomyces sp. JEL0708]
MPFQPVLYFTMDPANVEYVLKTNFENFEKGRHFHDINKDVLGNGIFNTDGETWRVQRKTASHIFNVKNFRDFVGRVFKEEAQILFDVLGQKADLSETVDMQDMLFKFTLDSFGRIGFNADLSCLTKENVPFAIAFDRAQTVLLYRFFSPLWRLEELLLPRGTRMRQDVHTIRSFALELIHKRRSDPEAHQYNDLLSLFMNQQSASEFHSDQALIDVVLNFIIAGRDTTAQALSWTFYLLSLYPHVEERLLAEITSTLGNDLSVYPSYEQVKEMKYANAVFHEALRLYPSVPSELKYAINDCVLPDGTRISAGNAVAWNPYCMGRCEEIWGSDAKIFRPERWLEMTRQPSPYAYPVFNAGPRVCLGKSMAELEGVFTLVGLVQRFKIKVLKPYEVKPANSLTLPMAGPLNCSVQRRQHAN